MKIIMAILLLVLGGLLLSGRSASAQSPTATPTLSPTPTRTNLERLMFATIPPPRICGTNFLPCGPLPYSVPRFPTVILRTSTFVPTIPTVTPIPVTATPTPTFTYTPGGPTVTATPSISPTPTIESGMDVGPISTLSESVRQIGGTLSVQSTLVVVVNGTPIGVTGIVESFASNIAQPFSFLRGLQAPLGNFGLIGTIMNYLFFVMFFVAFIRISTMAIPAIVSLIRFVMEIIQTIKPF